MKFHKKTQIKKMKLKLVLYFMLFHWHWNLIELSVYVVKREIVTVVEAYCQYVYKNKILKKKLIDSCWVLNRLNNF